MPLTKSLQRDIVSLGKRIEGTVANIEHPLATLSRTQINKVIVDIKELLNRIDREIPLLQLAITASGESLSSSLPPGISPSRLLQASTLLSVGDTQFSNQPDQTVQIGPDFCLSLYMLFLGHAPSSHKATSDQKPSANHPAEEEKGRYGVKEGDRKPIWQEVVHKARVKLCRAPCQAFTNGDESVLEYSYHINIVEDQDDGRVHEPVGADPEIDGYRRRGGVLYIPPRIEECIPVHQVSKIFYTDSGRLLNIGGDTQDEKKPILLLKRDINSTVHINALGEYRYDSHKDSQHGLAQEGGTQAELDRQLLGDQTPTTPEPHTRRETRRNGFPKHLDPEWIAMEMYEEAVDDDESSSEASDHEKEWKPLVGGLAHSGASPKSPKSPNPSKSLRSPRSSGSPESRISRKFLSHELEEERRSTKAEALIHKMSLQLSGVDAKKEPSKPPQNASVATKSPFGGITTSLSLIEMLIRLASLQEFQQASHLTIPDHILTFFLEETSTTGLVGEARWRARKEATTRVGFDPYSDNPGEGK